MKIIVFGATGDVGSKTIAEALRRGHKVTAVARSTERLAALKGDMTRVTHDLIQKPEGIHDLMAGHDAAISALRPASGHEAQLVPLTQAVLIAAQVADVPIYVTGGAATLKLTDDGEHTVLSAPNFLPDDIRPIAEACAAQDRVLNDHPGANWTCLRPPAMLDGGMRTGRYALGRDALVTDDQGNSSISYADFAVALLDLAELQPRPGARLTVGR